MPDPMSAVEIEDVLSSIRRLVSEELRPLNRSTPRERPGSRLVLTPAHRVPSRVPEMAAAPAPQAEPSRALLAALPASAETEPNEEGDVTRVGGLLFQSRMVPAGLAEPPQVEPSMTEDDAVGAPLADEPPFDEAALRDLIRDLIREELQGSLGERITRNVRKLVRAEIARAMSMRDLD